MTVLLKLFELHSHRQVILRTIWASLLIALIAVFVATTLWLTLYPNSANPFLGEIKIITFLLTIVIAMPVLYGMFFMSLLVSRKNDELFQLANLDPLTGIYNRRALADSFAMLARKARRNNESGILLVIDVDNFKSINDKFGHDVGDHVLIHLANTLRCFSNDRVCFARLGGEEFAVANFGIKSLDAFEFSEKIRKSFKGVSLEKENLKIEYTVSIGYCQIGEEDTLNTVLRNADAALYTAKRTGRNRTVCYDAGMASLAPEPGDLLYHEEKRSFSHALSSK